MAAALDFGLLGPLLVRANGTEVALGPPKQRAVLAMLAINRNRPIAVDSLINAAWDENPPKEARVAMHSYVSNLRRLLSSGGVDGRSVLVSAPPGYRLSAPDSQCDLGRFATARTAGVHAAAEGRFDEASHHLAAALSEWRGPVLEDLRGFQFADAFATALAEDRVMVHIVKAESEIACGQASSIILELETLTAEHPYHEPLWAQLITAYYVAERQSDALDAFRRLKSTLVDELGIDPGPTLQALHQRILRQEPLDVKRNARASGNSAIATLWRHAPTKPRLAQLHDAAGHTHTLRGMATRIGRQDDNDIVLDDVAVSRHHAVIVDTGTSFVITDVGSANGVEVADQRIHVSATLASGDRIRIGDHEFTIEINDG